MEAHTKSNEVEAVAGEDTCRSPAAVVGRMFHGSSHPSIRDLQCSYRDGVLTLGGCVPSYYLKQLAQTAAQETEGVQRVDNRIEVSS